VEQCPYFKTNRETAMHVFVTDPASNEVMMTRELRDEEILDPIIYAREWANANGVEIDETSEEEGGYIPDFSGDIRVELREDPANLVHIWSGRNYYIKSEDC
jgi:hypothetical protein